MLRKTAPEEQQRRKLNFHPIRFLKAKLSRTNNSIAITDNHIQPELPSEPSLTEEPCPSFEDFGAEAASLFSLDILEGCRITLNRNFTCPRQWGEIGLSQMVNLGTYPSIGSQAALIRALLQPQTNQAARGSKGEQQWSTSLRYSPPGGAQTLMTRYSSRTGTTEGRMVASLSQHMTLRGTFLSSSILSYLDTLKKIATHRPQRWLEIVKSSDISRDIAIATIERTSPKACLTLKASYQESPVYTLAYTSKLPSRWTIGTDLTLLKSSGAVLSNYGARFKSDNAIGCVIFSCSPNFEKPINEGLKERVYGVKSNVVTKLSERITAAAEVEVNPFVKENIKESLTNLKENFIGRVGYEYQFPQARICGAVDTNLCLQQSIEDATGLQMSGELDFKNDNYKFGFGFELASPLGQAMTSSEQTTSKPTDSDN